MENSKINKPKTWKQPKMQVGSFLIPYEVYQMAEELRLKYTEVLEFGIRFKYAELSDEPYPPNKLTDKVVQLQQLLMEKNKQEVKENDAEKEGPN